MSGQAAAVVHPRVAPTSRAVRVVSWWARALARAVEEAAYAERDLVTARALARGGRVGGIRVEPGRCVAAVEDERGLWTAQVEVPLLDDASVGALVETVAAESGRIASLLAGDLPHDLVEHAEEAGVELLPYGGELAATCSCRAWVDPCVHALAVLQQVVWLSDADPFVLLHLRGLPREVLLAQLHARAPGPPDDADDLAVAYDAAARAARVLELLTASRSAATDLDGLF